MANISVSISNDNIALTEINESSGETLPDLISALVSIKSQTNDYLTEIVEARKSQSSKETGKVQVDHLKSVFRTHLILPGAPGNGDNNTRPTVVVVPQKKTKV